MKKKIMTVVGVRPQFIKAAPLSRLLRKNSNFFEILVHTGQHYDSNMSDIFFAELELPRPQYNLEVGSASHSKQTAEMLVGLEKKMIEENPHWVLIYGDTNSTLAAALAAAKLQIPVAHIEAGLRSFNRRMPEEVNRLVADQVSEVLFAPTETAVKNLKQEGFLESRIHQVGDIMYDVALYYGEKAQQQSSILRLMNCYPKEYVLATVHRQENTDDPKRLMAVIEGLNLIANEFSVILPLHPRTHKMLGPYNLTKKISKNIHIINPVGFLDMIMLEKNARVIATDSGGVQKEAFFYGVPCVTLRDETEWVELIDLGWSTLVPPKNAEAICQGLYNAMEKQPKNTVVCPYGDGTTAEKIINVLQGT